MKFSVLMIPSMIFIIFPYEFLIIADSVLTAEQITRMSETEFKCTLPAMNFFGMKIQPVLYVDVNVYPQFNRSEIVVIRAETIGSETAERVNGTFSLSAINVVSAGNLTTSPRPACMVALHENTIRDSHSRSLHYMIEFKLVH